MAGLEKANKKMLMVHSMRYIASLLLFCSTVADQDISHDNELRMRPIRRQFVTKKHSAFATLEAFAEWLCVCDVGMPAARTATTTTLTNEYAKIMDGARHRCSYYAHANIDRSQRKKKCAARLYATGRLPPFPALHAGNVRPSPDRNLEQRMPGCAGERLPPGQWPPARSQLARAVAWAKKTKILMIGDSTVDAKAYVLGRLGVQTEACSTESKKYNGGLCTMRTNQQFMYSKSAHNGSYPLGWPVLERYPSQSNNNFQLVIWNIGTHLLDRTPAPNSNQQRQTQSLKIDLHLANLKGNAAALRRKYPNAKHVYLLTNRMCSDEFDGTFAQQIKTWRERSGAHGNSSIEYDDRMQFSHIGTDNWNRAEQELSKEGWIIFDPAISAADCACTPANDGRHYLMLATSFWERIFETFGGDQH